MIFEQARESCEIICVSECKHSISRGGVDGAKFEAIAEAGDKILGKILTGDCGQVTKIF